MATEGIEHDRGDTWLSTDRDGGRSGATEKPQVLSYVSGRSLTTLRDRRYLLCSESVLAIYHMNNHLTLPGIDVFSYFGGGWMTAVARLGGT